MSITDDKSFEEWWSSLPRDDRFKLIARTSWDAALQLARIDSGVDVAAHDECRKSLVEHVLHERSRAERAEKRCSELAEEAEKWRADERRVSEAYVRLRSILGAWGTKTAPRPIDVYDLTEHVAVQLKATAERLAKQLEQANSVVVSLRTDLVNETVLVGNLTGERDELLRQQSALLTRNVILGNRVTLLERNRDRRARDLDSAVRIMNEMTAQRDELRAQNRALAQTLLRQTNEMNNLRMEKQRETRIATTTIAALHDAMHRLAAEKARVLIELDEVKLHHDRLVADAASAEKREAWNRALNKGLLVKFTGTAPDVPEQTIIIPHTCPRPLGNPTREEVIAALKLIGEVISVTLGNSP